MTFIKARCALFTCQLECWGRGHNWRDWARKNFRWCSPMKLKYIIFITFILHMACFVVWRKFFLIWSGPFYLVKVKNLSIPEQSLLFEEGPFSFPLLLHSGVCCSAWWWLALKQIPLFKMFFSLHGGDGLILAVRSLNISSMSISSLKRPE